MTTITFSALPAGSALTGPEYIAMTQSGISKYTTPAAIKTYVQSLLGTMATQSAGAVAITGGTISGVTGVVLSVSGTANQITASTTAGATTLSLPNATVVPTSIATKHFIGNSTTPTIATGTGAGTTPTIAIAGTDAGFQITLTTGTSPAASNATIATVTFNTVYASAPYASRTAVNNNAAALTGTTEVFPTTTTSTLLLKSGSAALTAATQYIWHFLVVQ